MQINELLILEKWFEKEIKNKQIPQKYTQLHSAMQQHVNVRNNNQPKQPFDTQRDALLESLSTVAFSTLTIEQIKLLEVLEIKELFGVSGVSAIEDILYKNQLDIAAATKNIGENVNKINKAVQKFDQIKASFAGIYTIEEAEETPEGHVLMRIYFQGDSSMKTVTEFKKLGNQWYEIGRGIAMSCNGSPADLKIIGAHKGSVVLELAVIAGIATSISTILLAGLEVAEKSIDILKKVEELKALKLSNKKIVTDLEKEAIKEREKGINEIVQKAIEEHSLKQESQGDIINALEKSVKNLIDFTEHGGKVDFIQPEQGEEVRDSELITFRENCKKIRIIEHKIKYIEHNIE